MDLETIGKQILEALAVQGQIAGLEAKLAGLNELGARATKDIEDSIEEKKRNVIARGEAEKHRGEMASNVEKAKSSVMAAQIHLKSAKSTFEETEQEVAKYSDTVLARLDEATKKFEAGKKALEADKVDLLEALKAAKKDLELRQAVLADQGIELNIGGKPLAKTTYL